MAVYQYLCEACGEITERFTHSTDPIEAMPLKCKHCEMCASLSLVVAGGTRLQFKGTGFHATDYPPTKTLDRKKVFPSADVKGGGRG